MPRQDDASQQDQPSQQSEGAPHNKESDGGDSGDTSTGNDQTDRSQELADAEQQARDALTQFGNDAPTIDFSSSPLDPAAAREINNAIQQLAADYPETMRGLSHIGSGDFSQSLGPGNDDVLAYATPGATNPGIYINHDAFSDNAQRAQDGASEEQTGFTVPGGGSTEGVFTHEFGHHLGEQLLNNPQMLADLNQAVSNALGIPYDATQPHDPATQQRIADALSEYGSGDSHEMMAEAFTEYRLSDSPRDLANAIGQVMDRHLGGQNTGTQNTGTQNTGGSTPAPGNPANPNGNTTPPRSGETQPPSTDPQSRSDGTPPRTDDGQPRSDSTQQPDGTQQRGDDGPRPGEGEPRFRRGDTDDSNTSPGDQEPPARTDPPAGRGLPHQQADWAPPSYTREDNITLRPNERLVQQGTLEPRTKYTVYETDASGNRVPRSEAYTDGDGNVTHITNVTPDPGTRVVDPNENIDLTRPEPGVTHKVELGFDNPHIFTGEPHTGGREGMAPSAARFDPPADATPVRWQGTYDVGTQGPFSARQDLPPNSRIEVRGPGDRLHGVFWTDANRQVTHARTWYGDRQHGFNPELGDSNATVKKYGVPRPNTHYLAEPHDRFQTSDPDAPLDPPDATRSGDFGDGSVEPGTFLFHTDHRGQTDAAAGRPEYDTPHADEEQRNTSVQKKAGHIGKATGEYPGGRFDGGHIFPHEARGPGERINYFPQWSPTNRGNSGTGLTPGDTWRQSFESLLEQRHSGNPDVTIERIDFFPEPNDPKITPEVVHTRWTETDNSQTPPVTTTHYRSYHNLDPSQRAAGGTPSGGAPSGGPAASQPPSNTPPGNTPPGNTAPTQPSGNGQPTQPATPNQTATPNQAGADNGSQSSPAGGNTTPESNGGDQPRFRRSNPAPEPDGGQAPRSDAQQAPPRTPSEETRTSGDGTDRQSTSRPDARTHYGWYEDGGPRSTPSTSTTESPTPGTPTPGTPAAGTATPGAETAAPRSGDASASRPDGRTDTGTRLQDASAPPAGHAVPRSAESEGSPPRTAEPELMRRIQENQQVRQMVDEARGTVVDDRGNRLGDLLADDLRNRLPNHPHLARIIEGGGPPPLTPAEESVRQSLLARPRTLHSLLTHSDAVHILEDSIREVNERGADAVLREGQVEPTPTPLEDWQVEISDRAIDEIGPGKSPKQPGFDEEALAAEQERAGGQPLSKDNELVNRYLDELYQKAAEGTGTLRNVLNDLAGDPDDAKMRPGPKDRVRALDKIINESDGDASALNDLLGGKVQFDSVSDLYRALDRVREVAQRHGVEVVSIKDRLRTPQPSGYRDIRMTVRMPNGHIGELRLHLRPFDNVASYEHSLYEVSRDLPNVAEERAARGERDAPLTPEERAVREVINRRLNERFDAALNESLPPHLRTTREDGDTTHGDSTHGDSTTGDASHGDGQPPVRREDAESPERAPETIPDGLPPHLHDTFRDSDATPAGRSFHDPADPAMRDLARRVPADPQRFTVDGHGDADGLRLGGGRRLNADDLAHLIRNDPNWNGREILLLSCRTGDGDFAAQLAQRLGVPVTAPNGLAWSDGDGNVYASSGQTGPDGRTRPGWPPNGTWQTFNPDGTTSTAGRDGRPPGREDHRGPDPARPADDAEARGLRDWFRREGHVDRDGYRRFDTDEQGERYGENRLSDVYRNLPHQLQQALHWYTVQSMPNPQLRPGADVGRYLTHLFTEQNYVQHLAYLNGGGMPVHRNQLMQMWNRPDLTDYQRQLIQHVLTQTDPEARLQEMWQNHEQREFLRRYLGGEPTPDAFWRRINELDHALSQPLPEPVQAVRGLHDVDFMLASDGRPLAGRHPMLLIGAVQNEPGYMSTSLGSGTTEVDGQGFTYQLHLNLPEGAHGVWMGTSSAYPDQRELVLPRGTRYYVRNVVQTGWNGTQPVFSIEADVIPPGAAP